MPTTGKLRVPTLICVVVLLISFVSHSARGTNQSKNQTSKLKDRIETLEKRIRKLESTVETLKSKHALNKAAIDTSFPDWLTKIKKHPSRKALGDTEAPVRITEYIDFQCPFCLQYQRRVFPKLREQYIRTGKVYYEVRHFPLSRIHKYAFKAAVAAECALNQQHFWQFRHFVFSNHDNVSEQLIRKFGTISNIPDNEAYRQCVKQEKPESIVKKEFNQGRKAGVKGTPTFIVNEEKIIRGAQAFKKFEEAIESYL